MGDRVTERAVGLLARLVAFDTTSARSNLPLIDWVEERLTRAGAACRRLPDPTGDQAGLLARLGGESDGPPVVLSGHTDCVPAEPDRWRTDPWELTAEGGRLVGRGTADMKGFLAAVLAVAGGTRPRRPVVLALSRDEELGTLGGPDLVAGLRDWGVDPSAVVVGEPTGMRPVVAHKGLRSFRTVVTGQAGHSSAPGAAANAVAAAARIVTFLDDLSERHPDEVSDQRFDPPHTTFNPGVIDGGSAVNVVPASCELEWEYRPVPADDADELADRVDEFVAAEVLPRLCRRGTDGDVTTTATARAAALTGTADSPAGRLLTALDGVEDGAGTVSFGTDGGHFHAAGWSTAVCGPGSIEQAHRPDEYLERVQLERCVAMIGDVFAGAGA